MVKDFRNGWIKDIMVPIFNLTVKYIKRVKNERKIKKEKLLEKWLF